MMGEEKLDEFRKIARTIVVIDNEDDAGMLKTLECLITLIYMWDLSDERYAKIFIDEVPVKYMNSLLYDWKYSKNIKKVPRWIEEVDPTENYRNCWSGATEILRCLCGNESVYERLCEWGIISEITSALPVNTSNEVPLGVLHYIKYVSENEKFWYKLLNESCTRIITVYYVHYSEQNDLNQEIKKITFYILTNLASNIINKWSMKTLSNSETTEVIKSLDAALCILLKYFENNSNKDVFELLLSLLIAIDYLLLNQTNIKPEEYGKKYLNSILYGLKKMYILKNEKDTSNKYSNISRPHLALTLVKLIGDWMGEEWIMTRVKQKTYRKPIDVTDEQLIILLVSAAVIEIELYLNTLEKILDGENILTDKLNNDFLLICIHIPLKALDYLNYLSQSFEEDGNCTKLSKSFLHLVDKLNDLYISIQLYLTKELNSSSNIIEINSLLLEKLIVFNCKWIVFSRDTSKKQNIRNFIWLLFDMCEKSRFCVDGYPLYKYAWFLEKISYIPEFNFLPLKENFLERLATVWIRGPSPDKEYVDYLISLCMYRFTINNRWISHNNLTSGQYSCLLKKLLNLISEAYKHVPFNSLLYHRVALSVIGAEIIYAKNIKAESELDIFVETFINAFTKGFHDDTVYENMARIIKSIHTPLPPLSSLKKDNI